MSILECRHLSKNYGYTEALDDVSFKLDSGHIVGLLGPNGSGKTTFIKLCNGLLTPSAGEILIDGKCPGPQTKAVTAYLPERIALPLWMTSEEAVSYYADFFSDFDRAAAMDMISRLGLLLNQRIKTMSKGTREKLQLILTMSRRAKLYFLDEPIGGVDPATRDYILNTIVDNYNPDATVVISTHLIADVEQILDQVLFIRDGHLVLSDDVGNLRSKRGKSVDEIFREEFRC